MNQAYVVLSLSKYKKNINADDYKMLIPLARRSLCEAGKSGSDKNIGL